MTFYALSKIIIIGNPLNQLVILYVWRESGHEFGSTTEPSFFLLSLSEINFKSYIKSKAFFSYSARGHSKKLQ